jgi:hypothetical protein
VAKRGAKPKKVKGEMVWIPDRLVSSIKKIKEKIAMNAQATELNNSLPSVDYKGYKISVTAQEYSFPVGDSKTAFTPKIYVSPEDSEGSEDDELINFNLDYEEPFRSYEGAIAVAKAWIDYEELKETYFF